MTRNEDAVRCERGRIADREAGANAERARFVARGDDDAATALVPADDDGLPAERGIDQPLDRHEERVEIEAADAR